MGAIKRDTTARRLLAKIRIDEVTGCWEWIGYKFWNGYGQIRHSGRKLKAHRVSYELHCGPIPDGLQALHDCDNPGCVNPDHLFLGTQAENVADRDAKGRQARGGSITANRRQALGTNHGRAKLTEADVRAIRAAEGATQQKLAMQYGVSRTQISAIRTGRRWSHMT